MKKSVKSSKSHSGTKLTITETSRKEKPTSKTITPASTPTRYANDDELNVMILSGKFAIETWFFELVESLFDDIYPHLLEGVDYSPQDLCGDEIWAEMTGQGQRLIILSLKHMAQLDDVPLIDLSCPNCDALTFQIIDCEEDDI